MSNPIAVLAACRPGGTTPAGTPLAISARHPYIGPMHSLLRFPGLWVLSLLLFTNSLGAQTPAPSPTSTPPIALKAARLFDGKSKTLVPNGVIVIEGNTITAAGSNVTIPDNAEIIDLGDATLSPGFIDAHTHLTWTIPQL
jgi:hypothetical protein